MRRLFPICRSITGAGVRQTLDVLDELAPLERTRVPTGTKCFDWDVPREWNVRDAYVRNSAGEKIIDFGVSNLHLVSYSVPVRATMDLEELQAHLHSLPESPDAIPYRASYYHENWGFCLTHRQRQELREDRYEVVIDTTLEDGFLDYGSCMIPGRELGGVLFSTYVCHPSLANNELSGPVMLATLMSMLWALPAPRYGYQALFAPETIGTISYLSRHHQRLKDTLVAGYVVSCVGDDGPFTYVRSKRGHTAADRAAEHVLRHLPGNHPTTVRDFDPVGSDERQYCSPGLNLPVGSMLRSRHGEYREYHTSEDNIDFVSEAALQDSLRAYLRVVQTLEINCRPHRVDPYCEPQLGKRGLYPEFVGADAGPYVSKLLNLLSFADGDNDLITIADRLGCPVWELSEPLEALVAADLIKLEFQRPRAEL